MIQFKKLAIAGAVSASIFGAASAEAHVMYNTFLSAGGASTDGWTRTFDGSDADTIATGPESQGNKGTLVPWLGTSGGGLPFGYQGSAHLNWAAAIHHNGTLEVSAAAAAADPDHIGAVVELDTGAGAWKDASVDSNGNPAPTGWKHQTEMGLIKSDISTLVRINLETVGPTLTTGGAPGQANDNFGVTIFTGMDTTTANYSHHGGWNNASKPENTSNPFYATGVGSGMTYLMHDATVDAANYIEFFATAGQVYTVAFGGNGVGHWRENISGYKMTISAVPVPGAVWLFGSAIAGMVGFGRRKAAVAA